MALSFFFSRVSDCLGWRGPSWLPGWGSTHCLKTLQHPYRGFPVISNQLRQARHLLRQPFWLFRLLSQIGLESDTHTIISKLYSTLKFAKYSHKHTLLSRTELLFILLLLYKWGNWGSEKLQGLAKVTQVVSSGKTRFFWFRLQYSFHRSIGLRFILWNNTAHV